ncbi:tetratricopeptide repeat protein [Hymenobacter fodinae]|uniref:tetratricopeptide repeat protein n=1 Tax=Hymenobacter fodinae TaxID=2510796 RepID=UPI0014369207|nr:tetratricopeptide repeat protein [Hymenobacter fodinae]
MLLNQKWRAHEALTAIRQALALDPQSSDAHYFHSIVSLRLDWPSAALEAINEALRLNSFNATYVGYKAVILNAQQQPEAALETAAQGLFLDPGHVECLYQRIRALKQLGRYELARVTLQQLVRWHPNLAVAHAQLGEEALRTQQLLAAENHFREAIRLNPTNEPTQRRLLPLLVHLGQEAQRQRNHQEARRYFLEVWQLNSGNTDARRGLEQLAKESFWLKRQFMRLDAWSASLQNEHAWILYFLVLTPLVALFCLPLIFLSIWAAIQWRFHPDVVMLNQGTFTVVRVVYTLFLGVACLVMFAGLLWFVVWVQTASGLTIGLLLVAMTAGIALIIRHEQHS